MPRARRTPWVLLGLLAGGPLSGYEIRQHIVDVIGHFWRESYGQIYPELARLARAGMIRPVAASAAPRRRTRYLLTAAGRRALAGWLATPPEPEVVRNEMLLRVFFGSSARPAALRKQLLAFRTRQEALRDYYALGAAEVATQLTEPTRTYWLLTLRSGQLVVEARLKWTDEAIAGLASR